MDTTYCRNKSIYRSLDTTHPIVVHTGGTGRTTRTTRTTRTSRTGRTTGIAVLSPPYEKITWLDANTSELQWARFAEYRGKIVVDLMVWYVVTKPTYTVGKSVPASLSTSLAKYPHTMARKFAKHFRAMTLTDIHRIRPDYLIVSDCQPYAGYHIGIGREDAQILANNKLDIKVFLSRFTSRDKPMGDFQNPFDSVYRDLVVGLVGRDLIAEQFDKSAIHIPKNIHGVMWYQIGIPDMKPWYALLWIRYKSGYLYGLFCAECCYTGFDVAGDMRMYLSRNICDLLEYGADNKIRARIKKYIAKLTKKLGTIE
jgi:hypothetical protein